MFLEMGVIGYDEETFELHEQCLVNCWIVNEGSVE